MGSVRQAPFDDRATENSSAHPVEETPPDDGTADSHAATGVPALGQAGAPPTAAPPAGLGSSTAPHRGSADPGTTNPQSPIDSPTDTAVPSASDRSGWGLGISGGGIFALGDNTEEYNVGYHVAVTAEYRLFDHFGLGLESGYAYIYADYVDLMPNFGLWINNRMWFTTLQPRLYLPVGNHVDVLAVGGLGYTRVWTDASYYAFIPSLSGPTEILEDVDQTINVFVFEVGAGLQIRAPSWLTLGIEAVYNPLDVADLGDLHDPSSISTDKHHLDEDKVQIQAIRTRLRALFRF